MIVEKNLARQAVNNIGETVYTVPASTTTILRDINIINTGSTDCWVSIWLVPSGASRSNECVLLNQIKIFASDPEPLHWDGYQILDTPGDTIQAMSETTDQITVHIAGAEIT